MGQMKLQEQKKSTQFPKCLFFISLCRKYVESLYLDTISSEKFIFIFSFKVTIVT